MDITRDWRSSLSTTPETSARRRLGSPRDDRVLEVALTMKICHSASPLHTTFCLPFQTMPRLIQSTLVPGTAQAWLDLLHGEARTIPLASSVPTLSMRILAGHDASWVRHELMFGLFRTSWTSRIELFDREAGHLVAQVEGTIFTSFRHEMRWQSSVEGVVVNSDLWWEGARPSLEQILSQSLVRFPMPIGQAPSFAESPTRRMVIDDRAINAA